MTAPRADLDELGRLLAEATPGPADPALIVALVNAAPALLAEVADLRETVARVKALADRWDITGDEDMRFRFVEQLRAALDGAQ